MKKRKILKLSICLACLVASQVLTACGGGTSSVINSDQWVITLDFNDGVSRNGTLYVDKNESVSLPTNPVYEGWSFEGWKTEDGTSVPFEYTPTSDITLYASWEVGTCNVTFNLDYEDSEPIVQEVEYGSYITEAPVPTRPGYEFRYWSTISGGKQVDLSTYQIKGDYNFYAIWRSEDVKEFTVTITAGDYDGAPKDTVLTLTQEENIKSSNKALKVSRDGYDLAGWTTEKPSDGNTWTINDYDNIDSLLPDLVKFPYTPTSNVTLYAVWTIQRYTIIWNYNYTDSPTSNGVYDNYTILYGEKVTPPDENPTRPNYVFDGWYTSALGNEKVDFSKDVTVMSNTGYYAHWKHEGVETNVFQAEYVYFDPNKEYWGYSGSVRGQKCIVKDGGTVGTVMVDDYPLNSKLTDHYGYYVSYQYEMGCTLRFEINSSKATTATLVGNFAVENEKISNISNAGDYSNLIKVNGQSIDYSLNLSLIFQEHTVGQIQLQEGLNVIEIVVNNSNTILGGTYKGVGFNTDYIKLVDTDATFTWSPIYDNLEALI